jgi:hypothetical protein
MWSLFYHNYSGARYDPSKPLKFAVSDFNASDFLWEAFGAKDTQAGKVYDRKSVFKLW